MRDPKTAKRFGVAVCYAVVFVTAFWLLFFHLSNHPLWGDEAETAVLAKNVLQSGVPQTFDGTNYILLHGTADETPDHVWIWSPWMQEYVTATSFLFFGATTWAARAPFALIGWFSLVLLALMAFKICQRHFIALAAVILLGSSEIFLLHARQCRYYSISVFTEILFIYGIYEMLAQNRRGRWLTAMALVVQFYSNYIVAVANCPALLVLAWMLRRRGIKAMLSVAMIFGLFMVAALPWLIYAHPWQQGGAMGGEPYLRKLWGYLLEFHFHFMPLCFLLLPIWGWIQNRGGESNTPEISKQWERLLLLLMPLFLSVILFAPGFYLRYLLPVLPGACLLAAIWIFRYVKWRWLAVVLILIQVVCNIFSIATVYPFKGNHHLRFPLVEFVHGMSEPYSDQFTDVVDFFNSRARAGEKILSFDPEFPLIFYTHLGIINGRLMAPTNGRLPDWILPQSPCVVAQQPVVLPDFLKPHYEKIVIMIHALMPGDGIPEPDIYQYQSTSNRAPFVIYKRKPGLQ